jgi:hypothetical protein
MSWVGTAIGVGVVASGAGAAVGANQASKDRAGARGAANLPGLDIPAAVGEAEQLTPRTRELEAQRNAFNRAQLLESLGIQVPGYQEAQAQRTQNAMALLRGELPPDVAAQVQRQAAGRALAGGYAGSQAAQNLTARDLGRTSLALQQAGGQQFANILGTTPLAPLSNYEFTPQMIASIRADERAKKQAALLGSYNMASAGGVAGQALGSLGSGLTNLGFSALGQGGFGAGGGGGGGGGNWNYSTGMPTGYGREGLL